MYFGLRASVQRSDRCVREDPQVRWHPGPVQRLHHFCCRHLHLPWHVFRPLRHPEASAPGQGRWCLLVILPRMGCHCHCWTHVLPHCHREEEDDDDLRRWRQVQGLHGLLPPSHQERGIHVSDEGSRSKHPAWRRRRWCACRFRQVPGHVHRLENCQRLGQAPRVLVYHPPKKLCAACPAAKQKKLVLNINHFYNLFVNLQQTSCRDMKTSPPETHLHLNCISLIVVVHFGNIVQHLKKK